MQGGCRRAAGEGGGDDEGQSDARRDERCVGMRSAPICSLVQLLRSPTTVFLPSLSRVTLMKLSTTGLPPLRDEV